MSMTYILVTAKSADQLVNEVNKRLADGFRCVGDLQVIAGTSGRDTFYQPMLHSNRDFSISVQ